jgi:hypothetical protein
LCTDIIRPEEQPVKRDGAAPRTHICFFNCSIAAAILVFCAVSVVMFEAFV